MKILIPCNGTRGDIQPYVSLACSLKRLSSDYDIILGGPKVFEEFVTNHGLAFFPIEPSITAAVKETDAGKALNNPGLFGFMAAAKAFFSVIYESW